MSMNKRFVNPSKRFNGKDMVVVPGGRSGEGTFPWAKKGSVADPAAMLPPGGSAGDYLVKRSNTDYDVEWQFKGQGYQLFTDSQKNLSANSVSACTFSGASEIAGDQFLSRNINRIEVIKTGLMIIEVFVRDWGSNTDGGNRMIDLKLNGSTYHRTNRTPDAGTAFGISAIGYFAEQSSDYFEVDLRCGQTATVTNIVFRAAYLGFVG